MKRKWSFEYQWKNYSTEHLTYGLTAEKEFQKFIHDLRITKKNLNKKKILDAGCGSGRLTRFISKYGAETYGVDIIPLPKDKKVKFIQADIQNLPFKNNFFDYIYSEGVLHHTENPKKAFKELARVNKRKLFT